MSLENKYPLTSAEEEIIKKENEHYSKRKVFLEEDEQLVALKVKLKLNTINNIYNVFIQRKSNYSDAVYLNQVLLEDALTSYVKDIHRYKNYCAAFEANKQKQAAYTIKWLVRFRPIQIKENADISEEQIILINLEFALSCGFSYLGQTIIELVERNKRAVDEYNNEKLKDKKIDSFYDRLIYDLRYRELSGKKLILTFDALELAVNPLYNTELL